MTSKIKKKIILNIPYFAVGLFCTNLGEAWRIAWGSNMSEKVQGLILYGGFKTAFANRLPSFHPLDLAVSIACGAGLRLAVFIKSKNAKKFRHGEEHGSARWSA